MIRALLLAALLMLGATSVPAIPSCPEDAVLVGTGDYIGGHWTGYECGPAVDDYTTEEIAR